MGWTPEDGIERIVVAVPARDEGTTIAECLRSLDAAAAIAGVPVHVVLAADSCRDDTAEAARSAPTRHCTVTVVEGRWGGAGAARRAAVDAGLAGLPDLGVVWVANTDADTSVPDTWLRDQLELARRCDAVAGIVDLDPARVSPVLLHRFRSSYVLDGDRHAHVHGANLGLRADVYRDSGGWCANTVVGEDHGLWARVLATGAAAVHSTALRVLTSARTSSRVDGGFASALSTLARTVVTPSAVDGPADQVLVA